MISVIMPVYNGAVYISEAIESILQQNIDGVEIIIIDDGSTDNTRALVNALSYPFIRYIYQENKGPSSARNAGLKMATYDYISFLDADDIWPTEKLQTQLNILKNSPDLKVVGGLIDYFYMPGSEDRKKHLQIEKPVFNVQLGALLIRKEILATVGYFDEQLRFSEDQDWLLRMREKNVPVQILNDVMLHYRIHSDNMTSHKGLKDLHVLKALKLSLDRRRNNSLNSLRPLDESWNEK